MTKHVPVTGVDTHPVFAYLSAKTGSPTWNFNKYLVNAEGEPVEHFSSSDDPMSDKMNVAIKSVLSL